MLIIRVGSVTGVQDLPQREVRTIGIKPGTHQANVKELAEMKADCVVASPSPPKSCA